MTTITELIQRRYDLEAMTNIPSMAEYANLWGELAAAFADKGAEYNNKLCYEKYLHYHNLAGGEYFRLQEVGYVDLIPVEFTDSSEPCTRIDTPTMAVEVVK